MSQNVSYAESTKKSAIWFTALPFATQMARFVNSIILARLLSPEAFGIIGVLSVLLYYSDTFSDFGFGKAIVQRKRIRNIHFRSYFSFNLLVSSFLFFLLIYNSDNIASFFDISELSDAIDVFGIFILITAFLTPIKTKLRREINFKTIAIIDAIRFGVQIPISLTLALNDYGFWSIIYAMISGQVFALAIFVFINKGFILPTTKIMHLKSMFNFSKWDFVAGQASLLSENMDKLFIAKYLGASYVGLFDRAQGIAVMPYMQISKKLTMVSFSSFSRFQNSKDDLDYYFKRFMSFQALLIIPTLVGLASVSELFVSNLLGVKWLEMIPTLKLMCVAFLIGSIANPFASLNTATGFIALQTNLNIACLLILLIALYNFTSYGIDTVAFCLIGFQVLRLIANVGISKVRLNLSMLNSLQSIMPFLCSGALMYMSVRAFYWLNLEIAQWKYLLLSIVLGAVVYSFCVLSLPFQSSNFARQKFKRLLQKLKLINDVAN